VLVPVLAAAGAGRPMPNPVAGLFAADLQQAGAVAALAQTGEATLEVDLVAARNAPRAILLRNAQPVGSFASGSVRVAVSAGDLLEIDGSAYRQPLTFRVAAAPGVAEPTPGREVTTRGDLVTLGRVRLQAP